MLTPEQLEQRKRHITGSDAAVICGLSPYKTRLQLWLEKTGRVIADDIGHLNHIKFGNYFEHGVADWFQAESGKLISFDFQDTIIHPTIPWMAGNIDFKIEGENAILECKTAFNDDGWGNGENIIPAAYLMQVAHYCAVGGFDKAYIAVVFAFKREMRWYVYDRNLKLEEKLIAREKTFWEEHVLADVAPEPVNEMDILSLYKETNNMPIIADEELSGLLELYKSFSLNEKIHKDGKQEIKDKIALLVKDADTILDNSGKILSTWKYTKPIQRFDAKQLRYDNPEIWEKYMRTDERQRRFRVIGDKDE